LGLVKKKNGGETNLNALVTNSATAPEFVKQLDKFFTFEVPGRFPSIIAMPGDIMPM
jgi:hypothetical protein